MAHFVLVDLNHCADEMVQMFAKHFLWPLDFLLKPSSQGLTELNPSYKMIMSHNDTTLGMK